MTDDCPAPRPHFYCQLFPSVPDTDDAVTESSLRDDDECTRSHLGLRRTIPIAFPFSSSREQEQHRRRRQRTNGEVVRGRKHSRSVFLATARLSVAVGRSAGGEFGSNASLSPSLSPHSTRIWPSGRTTDGRMDTEPAGGRIAQKRRQVTRNHNVFCFFHLNRLSHPGQRHRPPSLKAK